MSTVFIKKLSKIPQTRDEKCLLWSMQDDSSMLGTSTAVLLVLVIGLVILLARRRTRAH
jgi:hypothetical protein